MICVVDDDESVRMSTQALIMSAGYEVQTFASSDEFLKSGWRQRTDCLVLDVRMPEIDGFELQRRLRDQQYPIPIVFITAFGDDLLRQRALQNGAFEMLDKPFSAAVFLAAIEKALSGGAAPFHGNI